MAGSDEIEKIEKDEPNVKKKSKEPPPEVNNKEEETKHGSKEEEHIVQAMRDKIDVNCYTEEPSIQLLNQESSEIHLVKHLMKMKNNPSMKHLTKFVSRLDRVVNTINNLEGVKIMYKLSNEMSEKVKNNMKELECLSLEMKATLNNLIRLKEKRSLIRKEKDAIHEKRTSTKREELLEMERVLGMYDKDLLRGWQSAKKSSSIQSTENFIIYLKGKKQAVEIAFKLGTERLITMKNKQEKQSKPPTKNTIVKALPPPTSDSDQDSLISTD